MKKEGLASGLHPVDRLAGEQRLPRCEVLEVEPDLLQFPALEGLSQAACRPVHLGSFWNRVLPCAAGANGVLSSAKQRQALTREWKWWRKGKG